MKKKIFTAVCAVVAMAAGATASVDVPTVEQETDSVSSTPSQSSEESVKRTPYDIRFEGWGDAEWLDNEYIRTLRRYVDDYESGKVECAAFEVCWYVVAGKFAITSIRPNWYGGVFIEFCFVDNPSVIFSSWVYSHVDEVKEIVTGYEVRSVDWSDSNSEITKETVQEMLKENPLYKLW